MTQMLKKILQLSEAERILLVEAIWDSIGQESETGEISEMQDAELKQRLDSYRENPEDVLTWDEVKASIKR